MAAGLLLAAGCSSQSKEQVGESKADPATVGVATVDLRYPLMTKDGPGCQGALDYDGIAEGSKVTFRDQEGTVVGSATLAAPEVEANALDCLWRVEAELDGSPKFVTAKVAGWTSEPVEVFSDRAVFKLQGFEEKGGGKEARVDPTWTHD